MSADDVILVAETERMALASGPESGAQLKLNIEVNRPYYTRSKFNLLNDYLKEKRTLKSRVAGFVGKCFPPTTGCLAKSLLSFFPFINILKHYSIRGDFVNDLISGLTVGVMHIPQGMAYGMLANVDPVYGLYTSFFPVIIYFFLGTSRHISMGTFAVVSLMVGSAVDKVDCTSELTTSVNHPDSNLTVTVYSFQSDNGSLGVNATSDFLVWTKEEQEQIDMCKIGTATAVTLLAGILQLIMGMCRFGFVTIYLSDPLTRALTTGAGVHVFTSQIRHIFGIKTGRFNGPLKLVYTYIVFFQHIVQTNLASLIMAVICIAILYSFQRWVSPRVKAIIRMPLPTELLLLIFGTLISYFVKFSSKEVFNMKVVGPIPEGFPSPAFPHTSRFSIILSDAIAIALVSFTISISMTKLFAKKHNYSFDPNQELMAYGISNILCSTVNCYVSTASLSRSIVQESVGGRTQVAGLVSCVVLFVVLLAVGPLFRELPNCVLAAIIIVNLRGIFLQVKDIKDLWRLSFFDMLTWIVTCLAVILTDVDIGLVIGVVFSLLSIVFRTQSPHTHILGRIPRTDVYEDVHHYPAAKQISNIKIFCFSSSLYYANAGHFVEKLYEKTECKPATVKSARNRMQRQLNAQKIRAQGHAMKLCRNASKKETNLPISFVPDVPIDNNNHAKDAIADEDDRSYCSISNIIIDCTSMVFIDVVGIATLKQVVEEYKEIGVSVSLARCNEEIFEILQKAIECKKMSNCRIYLTVHDAVISAVDEDYSLKSQLRHDFNNIIAA